MNICEEKGKSHLSFLPQLLTFISFFSDISLYYRLNFRKDQLLLFLNCDVKILIKGLRSELQGFKTEKCIEIFYDLMDE